MATSKLEEARKRAQEKQQEQPVKSGKGETRGEAEKAAYINTVAFSGRLGKDVEYQTTSNGVELAKSSIAVFNPGVKKEDEHGHAMWFDLTLWHNEQDTDKGKKNTHLFEVFLEMTKGQEVTVEGRLTMRLWQEKPYYNINLTDIG